ncbi:DUF6783 domain-containing protein [Eisenbergiella tayi]|uniref:DUF6783 domain-containing protein n=1 Tax=Eisenbergiella tayi TaxID=1432052 RepID=UPI0028A55E76|nr:DUF6783 domain-containing protein [Eisenbergiella tayi]MDT4533056.1 hypothetical protein [Eisenbergiella tayi]
MHFYHLPAPLCIIFNSNSVNIAHYASLIVTQSPTNQFSNKLLHSPLSANTLRQAAESCFWAAGPLPASVSASGGGVSGYRAAESLPWQSQTKKGAVSNCFVPMFHCRL